MQQYRDFLFREGEQAGIDFWLAELSANRQTRTSMVEQFLNSNEFGQIVAPIVRMNLIARNGALPDYNTLLSQLEGVKANTLTNTQIARSLTNSSEYLARYSSLTGDALINALYTDSLGRAPTSAELAAARSVLSSAASPTEGTASLIVYLSNQVEFIGADANPVTVIIMYVSLLDRAPEPAGYSFWVQELNRATSTPDANLTTVTRNLIDVFLAAAEYRARFLPQQST